MQGLIHWYNVNRKMIWAIIGTIVAVFIGIQLISGIVNNNNKDKISTTVINTKTNTEEKYNTVALDTEESVITGNKLSNSQKEWISVIDKFVEYCNNKDITNAYNLLSEDCKNQIYSDINIFYTTYYSKIFSNGKKNIAIENWVNNIYKVKFEQDLLSLGQYEKNATVQDYITVVKDDNKELKLNINNYIGKDEINREKTVNDIKMKIIEKHKYIDYEIYTFEVTNGIYEDITLADTDVLNPIYLEDENKLQYAAYMNEIPEEQLDIMPGETKKISIKFYNKFSSSRRITRMCFTNIVYDYRPNLGYGQIVIDL